MERDKRRGNDQWRGCWTFKDIICDGSENRSARKRDGGLRMGSDYWYYVSFQIALPVHMSNTLPVRD